MMSLATRPLFFAGLLAASAPLTAGSLVLTEGGGRPLTIEAAGVGELEVSQLDGTALADEFVRLCLPDPAGAYARASASPLGLELADATLPAFGKAPEAKYPIGRSYSAKLTVWNGDDGPLSKRPISIPSRAYVVTSQYGPFRATGEQCNLLVKVRDFMAAGQISDALTRKFGVPGKLVAKRTWADGFWTVPNKDIRLNFTTPSTDNGPRLVYLSAQVIGKEGSK